MMRRGFTLLEMMLASAIVGLSVLTLFEGVLVATRIAHENSQLLQAEAIAWDAAWKRFNEGYDYLQLNSSSGWQALSQTAAPELSVYDQAPQIKIDILPMQNVGWLADMRVIKVDVAWGPAANRRRLSDGGNEVRVCRGNLGRAP